MGYGGHYRAIISSKEVLKKGSCPLANHRTQITMLFEEKLDAFADAAYAGKHEGVKKELLLIEMDRDALIVPTIWRGDDGRPVYRSPGVERVRLQFRNEIGFLRNHESAPFYPAAFGSNFRCPLFGRCKSLNQLSELCESATGI